MAKKISIALVIVLVLVSLVSCNSGKTAETTQSEVTETIALNTEEEKYNEALRLYRAEEYESAEVLFSSIEGYRDSTNYLDRIYPHTHKLSGSYFVKKALMITYQFRKDGTIRLLKGNLGRTATYEGFYSLYRDGRISIVYEVDGENVTLDETIEILENGIQIGDTFYEKIDDFDASIEYEKAVELYNNKQYIESYEIFTELGDYKDSEEYAQKALAIIA